MYEKKSIVFQNILIKLKIILHLWTFITSSLTNIHKLQESFILAIIILL